MDGHKLKCHYSNKKGELNFDLSCVYDEKSVGHLKNECRIIHFNICFLKISEDEQEIMLEQFSMESLIHAKPSLKGFFTFIHNRQKLFDKTTTTSKEKKIIMFPL